MDTIEKIVQELDGIRRNMERDLETFRQARRNYIQQQQPARALFFCPSEVGKTLLSAKETPHWHEV